MNIARLGRAGRAVHPPRGAARHARVAPIALVGSTLIGIVLGTLITIDFLPLAGADPRSTSRSCAGCRSSSRSSSSTSGCRALPAHPSSARSRPRRSRSTLWGSAQVAEATRGAVQSIPREQHEAASALGFGWVGRHAFVILPQALRRLLPPLVGLLVNIIQNSTLAQVIGGLEILRGGRAPERAARVPADRASARTTRSRSSAAWWSSSS